MIELIRAIDRGQVSLSDLITRYGLEAEERLGDNDVIEAAARIGAE